MALAVLHPPPLTEMQKKTSKADQSSTPTPWESAALCCAMLCCVASALHRLDRGWPVLLPHRPLHVPLILVCSRGSVQGEGRTPQSAHALPQAEVLRCRIKFAGGHTPMHTRHDGMCDLAPHPAKDAQYPPRPTRPAFLRAHLTSCSWAA